MKYERLTKRFGDAVFDNCVNCDNDSNPMGCTEHCCYEAMKNRLAELEDKIEQGTLIELSNRKPLMWGKDGDTVHCQHCGEDLMGGFEFNCDGDTEIIQCPKCGGFVYSCIAEDYKEAKLKELQNG